MQFDGPTCHRATIFSPWQLPELTSEWLRVRKQLFIDELGWKLHSDNGIEIDAFDTDDAVHAVLISSNRIIGGLRAIRTTDPYLAQMVFPQLAGLKGYPVRQDVWEISRLGILRREANPTTRHLLHALMLRFAVSRNVTALIGIVDLAHARAMRSCGLTLRRYTPPQPVGLSVARRPIIAFCAELRLAEQSGPRFLRVMQLASRLEIDDHAVPILDRVSA